MAAGSTAPAAREANERGVALARQDRLREAAAAFAEACDHDPGYADAFSNLGATLRRLGDVAGAIANFTIAVERRPSFAVGHYNLGNALALHGRVPEAIAAYSRAIEIRPDYPEAWNNLGRVLTDAERYAEAVEACRKGLQCAPENASLHNNAANALRGLGRLEDAIRAYRRAIEIAPGSGEAHSNLGLALKEAGKLDAALAAHRRAVELQPREPAALNNLGTTLQAIGRTEEAIATFEAALRLDPKMPGTLVNLGSAEVDRNRLDPAIKCFRQAISLGGSHRDHAMAHKNLALSNMLSGNLQESYQHYRWRWKTREFHPRDYETESWTGAPFPSRTLFIHTEQGFGDAIQLARFAVAAKARGGTVLLEAAAGLTDLLATASGVDGIVEEGKPPPPFDLCVPIFDLLPALDVSLETIPATVPYLGVDAERRARWSDRIPATGRRRIGLVWAGRPTHRNDRNRSIPLPLLRPLLQTRGNDFYSLQVGPRAADLDDAGWREAVIDLSGYLTDFAETAAALEQIDLLISVDTAAVHLAGALGRSVWAMIPYAPDWRWMLDREDSPWYPTLRLFRQRQPRDWPEVVGRVRAALDG